METESLRVPAPELPLRISGAADLVRAALGWALLLWMAIATAPVLPGSVGVGLDASWGYALNLAHTQGIAFGRDFVFTYGPLGWLLTPDAGLTGAWTVAAFLVLLYLVNLYGLWRCWQRASDPLTGAACCLTVAAMQCWGGAAEQKVLTAFLGLALCVLADRARNRIELAATGIAAGLMLLMKVNDGVLACALFACLVCMRREWIYLAAAPIVTAAAFLLVQGNPFALFPYLLGSLQVMAGYSEAMSLAGPSAMVGVGLAAGLGLIVAIPALSQRSRGYVFGFVMAAISTFLFWKHAMVRHDGHADLLLLDSAAASLFLLVVSEPADRRILICFAAAAIMVNLFGLYDGNRAVYDTGWNRILMQEARPTIGQLVRFSAYWEETAQRTRAELDQRRLPQSIVSMVGKDAMDIMPHQIDRVRASGLTWRGRPIPQSYAAFSADLDSRNAKFLEGPGAPRWVALEWDAIDGRNPLVDDAASWRALFSHYDVKLAETPVWLLERRKSPRFGALQPVGSPVSAAWGQEIQVPRPSEGEWIVMAARIKRSAWGLLRGGLFRNEPILMEATYGSGRKVRARVTRANLEQGVLISHLPQNQAETRAYFGEVHHGLQDRIASLRWKTEDESEYALGIEIAWSKITTVDAPSGAPQLILSELWTPQSPLAGQIGAESVSEGNTLIVRPTTLDPQIVFNVKQDPKQFQTIMIRVRSSVGDRLNLFFGRQVEGRGLEGYLPVAGEWVDLYFDVASNPFWRNEAGSALRFDPTSDRSTGATIEIAGVWGSEQRLPEGHAPVTAYRSPAKH